MMHVGRNEHDRSSQKPCLRGTAVAEGRERGLWFARLSENGSAARVKPIMYLDRAACAGAARR
jgi:hypothetical protein